MMRGFFFVLTFTGALSAQSMVEFGAITAGTAVGGVAGKAAAADKLKAAGARVLGDGEPKIGAHGKPVLFLHPKDFCGTLVELEQV